MPRRSQVLSLALLAIGCARIKVDQCPKGEEPPAIGAALIPSPTPTHEGPSVADFIRIRTPTHVQVAPDGSVYMRDWPEGIHQLFVRAAGEAPQVEPQLLTQFPDGLASFWLSPDGRFAMLSTSRGGNEQWDLHLLDTKTRTITPFLEDPEVAFRFHRWLPDSSGILYSANDRSRADFHLLRKRIGGSPERLLDHTGSWTIADLRSDGKKVLVEEHVSSSDSRVHELDLRHGTLARVALPASKDDVWLDQAVGYLDDKTVIVVSDRSGERRLCTVDLATGVMQEPLPELAGHEVDQVVLDPEKRHVALTHNVDGYGDLHVYSLPRFERVPLGHERGVADISQLQGSRLVWSVSTARDPGRAMYTDLSKANEPARELALVEDSDIDLARFSLPELVTYESFDGRAIPAFLSLPPGHAPGEPIPFVLQFHGGPADQSRPGFDALNQFLLTQGFGILRPNVRGSTGYGRKFERLDDYRARKDAVMDGVHAAKYLVAQKLAAPGRIATFGGSYGGFMALAVVVEAEASLFGAAADVVGIVDFESFLRDTKPYRRKIREAEYGPLSDPEFLRSISPLHRSDEIDVPVLIAHGLNDPRVPVGEAMALAEALQRRGAAPELVFFADEGHGFRKLDNRELFAERLVAFLTRHLSSTR